MDKEITFYQDIKPLFREKDRNCMYFSFDLYNYEAVYDKADELYKRLTSENEGQMPPSGAGGKWNQEKIDKFKKWMETGKKKGLPPEREAFYKLLNNESFPEFLPTAKKMAYEYLDKAKSLIENPPSELGRYGKLLKHFKFTQDAFNKRLQHIYDYVKGEVDKYEPANDPIYNSRKDVIESIRQWAPFNQTDGAWLRYAAKLGPTDEITSLLSEILQDELGNGKVEHNHSTLYTTLLASCGIHLPEVYQRAYAEDPRFLDSAFSIPALSLCISQFSDLFFPEILGFTLLIEWTVLEVAPNIKLFKYYGLNPHFYEMHVAIDNASSGHGANAKRAIELYLDHVRQNGGDDAVQEHWRRIWIGFASLWSAGTLARDFEEMLYQKRIGKPDLRQRMIKMIAHKAPYASRNHNDRKFGDKFINELFNNPEGFLDALIESSYVVKGDPKNSPILSRLTTWDGPMYKVFTEEELNLWNEWIRSLDPNNKPSDPILSLNIVTEMRRLITTLKNNQYATLGHSHILTGPNPEDPDSIITKDIHWWFDQGDPIWIMKALICDKNEHRMVIPNQPENSPFITRMMAPANKMGSAFADIAISRGPMKNGEILSSIGEPWSWKDIAYRWIQLGCPLDQDELHVYDADVDNYQLVKNVDFQPLYTHHTGVISHHKYGPGGIH
ncbi:hypothetical protein C1646_751631 [Rhizophagus diaphanus]|nr:hypothetical protein C1646_751631 [Rhizophagus diaphanus] [Rhizophagus sp. MUCL 43196]